MKSGFWKTAWFLGLVVVVFMLLGGNRDLLESLRRQAYGMGVEASSRVASDKIAVIAIDATRIANFGRWTWSREVHAKMTDLLAGAKAKVIGNLVFFTEAQVDPGYVYVTKLLEIASKSAPEGAPAPAGEMGQMIALLKEAEQQLNTDRKLAESYGKANSVLLPMFFTLGEPRGKPDKPLPEFVQKNAISAQGSQDSPPLPSSGVQYPIDLLGKAAAGLGHLNSNPDIDGGVRTEPLVLQYFDQYYPSLSMMIAAKSLNLAPADIKVRLGEGVSGVKLKTCTDPALHLHTFFYKDRDEPATVHGDSFYDV